MISNDNISDTVSFAILFVAVSLYCSITILVVQNLPSLLASVVSSFHRGWSWTAGACSRMVSASKKRQSRTEAFSNLHGDILKMLYEKNDFSTLVRMLSPTLKERNPAKWRMILEIMAAIHFCFMMLEAFPDDDFRKCCPLMFGPAETANRACWMLTKVANKTMKEYPQLAPFLLQNLEDIFEGEDISLVWRRDGIKALPSTKKARNRAYRRYASLRRGALYRLTGQLVAEDHSCDDLMSSMAWHSHLKDDCSYLFLFSSNPSRAKRFFTEALLNNHFSWPVILALNDANKGPVVAEALMTKSPEAIERAIEVIQCEGIQSTCRQEFVIIERTVKDLMGIWRRKQEYKSRE